MRGILGAMVLVAALAGCAQPDPPLLTLGGRVCDAAPAMGGAIAVPFDSRSGASVTIGAASPCLQSVGRTATYAVFRLPDATGPYLATVTSELVGAAVIPPRATVVDDAGTVTRTVEAAEFRALLSGYQTGLRVGPRDRYVVVAADPALVGQRVTLRLSARETGVQVALAEAVPVMVLFPGVIPGQVTQLPATLSLNGSLRVAATPVARVP